jgi:hypothetical protein
MRAAGPAFLAISALFVAAAGNAAADSAGVTVKISAAQAAVAAGKGGEAAAQLAAAAEMLVADTSGADEYSKKAGTWQAEQAKKAAEALAKGAKIRESELDVIGTRARDLYGAVLPAGRGDLAAAAAFVKKLAGESDGKTKEKLDAAAKMLDDSAAGKGNRTAALAMMKVTLGSTVCLLKARELAKDKKPLLAGGWAYAAVDYLKFEQGLASEAAAEDIRGFLTDGIGMTAFEVERGRPMEGDDLADLADSAEETILYAYKGGGAEAAKPAAK